MSRSGHLRWVLQHLWAHKYALMLCRSAGLNKHDRVMCYKWLLTPRQREEKWRGTTADPEAERVHTDKHRHKSELWSLSAIERQTEKERVHHTYCHKATYRWSRPRHAASTLNSLQRIHTVITHKPFNFQSNSVLTQNRGLETLALHLPLFLYKEPVL